MQTQVVGQELGVAIRETLPPELTPVFLFITYLGSAGFLLGAFTLDYWFGDRKRGAHSLGILVAGLGLVVALKSVFAFPRPPESLRVIVIDGYSFPSGHAVQSTVGYGILAHDHDVGSRYQRAAAAGAMIFLVCLSRVVLGVHYVRDVAVGFVVAALFLAAAIYVTKHAPEKAFWLAGAIGVAAVAATGAGQHALAILGGAVGGALTWRRLGSMPGLESLRSRTVLVVGVLPVLLLLGYVATQLHPPPVVVAPVTAVIFGGVLSAPVLAHWFE